MKGPVKEIVIYKQLPRIALYWFFLSWAVGFYGRPSSDALWYFATVFVVSVGVPLFLMVHLIRWMGDEEKIEKGSEQSDYHG